MNRWWALTAAALVMSGTVATAGGIPHLPPAAAAVAPPTPAFNNDPDYVAVYTDNVENAMQSDASAKLQCNGDFDDLLARMELWAANGTGGVAPDLFLVQQVSSQHQADAIADDLSAYFGKPDDPSTPKAEGVYAARVADGAPAYWGGASCDPAKDHQTNAVIYREDRFDVVASMTWFPMTAASASGCTTQRAERTETLGLTLRDDIADRDVTVASVHWPLDGSYVCALDSWDDAAARVWHLSAADTSRSDLLLIGGDFNHNDFRQTAAGHVRPRGWFAAAGATGSGRKVTGYWHDAVSCADTGRALKDCSVSNFTASCELTNEAECADNDGVNDAMRFDFLFAKHRDRSAVTLRDVATITWREAEDAGDTWVADDYRPANAQQQANRYSNHRAVRAKVYYRSSA